MIDVKIMSSLWKVVIGVATAAAISAAGFTWSTNQKTQEMQIQLSGLCITMPELKTRVDKLSIEVETTKLADVEMKGRLFFLEKTLETFERRLSKP